MKDNSFEWFLDNAFLFESELRLAREYIINAGDRADLNHFVSVRESVEREGGPMGMYTKELLASFTRDLQEESNMRAKLVSTLEAAIADVHVATRAYAEMQEELAA